MDIRLPVTLGVIRNSPIEFLNPEHGGLVVGTALLSCLEADIYILPVWPPFLMFACQKRSHRFRDAILVCALFQNITLAIRISKMASI